MVLRIRFPKLESSIPWIESFFSRKYVVKKYPIHRYRTLNEVAGLLNLSSLSVFRLLVKHPRAHAFEYDNKIYVHPDAVVILARARFRGIITKELKKSPLNS